MNLQLNLGVEASIIDQISTLIEPRVEMDRIQEQLALNVVPYGLNAIMDPVLARIVGLKNDGDLEGQVEELKQIAIHMISEQYAERNEESGNMLDSMLNASEFNAGGVGNGKMLHNDKHKHIPHSNGWNK